MHSKVGNKPHPASRGFLSRVGPTGSNSRWIDCPTLVLFILLYNPLSSFYRLISSLVGFLPRRKAPRLVHLALLEFPWVVPKLWVVESLVPPLLKVVPTCPQNTASSQHPHGNRPTSMLPYTRHTLPSANIIPRILEIFKIHVGRLLSTSKLLPLVLSGNITTTKIHLIFRTTYYFYVTICMFVPYSQLAFLHPLLSSVRKVLEVIKVNCLPL